MHGWTHAAQSLNTGTALQRHLDLAWGADDQDWLALAAAGLWDCLPVGRILPAGTPTWQRQQLLVLRLVPGLSFDDCPLALACPHHGESSLIAANLGELLPSYLYERLFLEQSGLVERLTRCGAEEWAEVAARWGVDRARVDRIQVSLKDPTVLRALRAEPGFEACTEGIQALADWVDGLPRAAVVRAVLAERLDQPWQAPDLALAGAWGETLTLFSAVQAGERIPERALRQAQARAPRVPMPHEAAYMGPDLYIGPCQGTAWSSYSLHRDIATAILEEEDAGRAAPDALAQAACSFARLGPEVYDGQAHLDAASALAETGDLEGSLSALLTAVAWQRARHGAPLATALRAWIQGTAEAGAAWDLHHALAVQMGERMAMAGRSLTLARR